MKCAVIDISSTGVSTVIAECDKSTGVFETVYKDRINIAIFDYFNGRIISDRGIEKIIDGLITARSNAKALGAEECYVISTAALRNIDNIGEVAEKVRMRTGIVINHLDGKTEAYCDFVSNRKYSAYDRAILIDIGGGSVELCDLSKESKNEMVCLEFGTIKLRKKYIADIYPTEDEAKRVKKFLRKKCDEANLPGKGKFDTVILVGSINDAIYATYREFCEKKKLPAEFSFDRYKKFVNMLLTSTDRTMLIMKTAPEKINALPVAALILKELLRRFKPADTVVSDCGVKEGYLALVAFGGERAVPVDLSAPVPAFIDIPSDTADPSEKGKKKSPAAKKPAEKKPAAKKQSAKKPAAKKPAEKKPADKAKK